MAATKALVPLRALLAMLASGCISHPSVAIASRILGTGVDAGACVKPLRCNENLTLIKENKNKEKKWKR
jgi:hypothetical protein